MRGIYLHFGLYGIFTEEKPAPHTPVLLVSNSNSYQMETQNNQQNSEQEKKNSGNVLENNPSDNKPDENNQNETGYAGTTNSISENHQETDEYQIAVEDTMIGYDGDDDQLDMNLDKPGKSSENTRGIDDND